MSYITLNTSLSSKVEGKKLIVNVSTTNKGDESAYNVRAEIKADERTILASKQEELAINGIYQKEFILPLYLAKPGTYPLALIMHYTDANQYPFSALTCQTFAFQKESSSPVFGKLSAATFAQEGQLRLTLKNLSEQEIKIKNYLLAPKELTVTKKTLGLTLPPRSEKKETFGVKNFSAQPGSTYQVFAISEAENKDLHYTSISPGTVKIVASQGIFGLSYPVVFTILIALVIIFIGAQFFKKGH